MSTMRSVLRVSAHQFILITLLAAGLLAPSAVHAAGPPRQIASPQLGLAQGWFRLLHQPMTGTVNAVAFVGNDLYIAGNFTFITDDGVTVAHNIARYSGGAWSALANVGVDNGVNALAVMGSDLYVGGVFSQTADGTLTNINNIAKYDTAGQSWSGLAHLGIGGNVVALAVIGSDVYVGGNFIGTADGAVTDLNGIARYGGGVWSPLAHKGLNGIVMAMAVSGSTLYVGGTFDFTFDMAVTNLTNIARYSGGAWSALANHGLNGPVISLAATGTDVYAGGAFIKTGDSAISNLNHIAHYDVVGGTWSALAHNGLNGNVRALALNGSDLYAGGVFSKTFDLAVSNLNAVARYDTAGGTWSALPNQGLSSDVLAIIAHGGDTFIGGMFGGTFDATYLGQIVKLGRQNVYIPVVQH